MICEYGCGQEAKYKFIGRGKIEKWCCEPHYNKCSFMKSKYIGNKNPAKRLEIRKKISEALKGREYKKEWKKNLSAVRAGKKYPKLSQAKKGSIPWNKGRPWSKKEKTNISNGIKNWWSNMDATIYSKICKKYIRPGEKNSNWKGGTSKLPYAPDWGPKVKRKVLERDNHVCQNCEEIENLSVHHINYDKMNCDSTNLITLCSPCNSKANGNRDYWKRIYEGKIIKWA